MAPNTKIDILLPAWEMTRDDVKIKNIYFFPWLLSIIFLSVLLVYQSIYTYVVVFNKKEKALELVLDFFHSEYITETLIAAIIFFFFYILILPVFEGALIRYIAKKDVEKEACSWDCLSVWIYKFLPLFKYSNLFSEFKFISVINAYLFIIRFMEGRHIKEISYMFLALFLFSIIINILISYSKFIIVLENKWVFPAVSKSIKLAIINLVPTIKIYFFMFFLNIRVIINFFVFLTFPVLIVLTIWFITTQIYLTIAITILSSLFLVVILFLWYLAWTLEVFKNSIWYFAYKQANEKLKSIWEGSNDD